MVISWSICGEKSPDTAVLRHEGNQKWYAVLMKIPWDKLEKGQRRPSRSSQPQTRPSS